jgi:hypothetical protein
MDAADGRWAVRQALVRLAAGCDAVMVASGSVIDESAAVAASTAAAQIRVELLDDLGGLASQGGQRYAAERRLDVVADQALVARSGVLIHIVLREPLVEQVGQVRCRAR